MNGNYLHVKCKLLALTVCDFFESVDCVVIPLAAVNWMHWLNICQKTFYGLIAEKIERRPLISVVELNLDTNSSGYVVMLELT